MQSDDNKSQQNILDQIVENDQLDFPCFENDLNKSSAEKFNENKAPQKRNFFEDQNMSQSSFAQDLISFIKNDQSHIEMDNFLMKDENSFVGKIKKFDDSFEKKVQINKFSPRDLPQAPR